MIYRTYNFDIYKSKILNNYLKFGNKLWIQDYEFNVFSNQTYDFLFIDITNAPISINYCSGVKKCVVYYNKKSIYPQKVKLIFKKKIKLKNKNNIKTKKSQYSRY